MDAKDAMSERNSGTQALWLYTTETGRARRFPKWTNSLMKVSRTLDSRFRQPHTQTWFPCALPVSVVQNPVCFVAFLRVPHRVHCVHRGSKPQPPFPFDRPPCNQRTGGLRFSGRKEQQKRPMNTRKGRVPRLINQPAFASSERAEGVQFSG